MKIVHTSDWHLGRSFGPVSLRAEQEAFCDWLVDLVAAEAAELVVIAGDLYDRAIAPTEAIALFRHTVGRLLAAGTVVVAITGNHDGADRVAPYGGWLDGSRFYLRGGYDRVGSVLTHPFRDGPLDLVLLPYLDPRAAPDLFGDDDDEAAELPADLLERRRARTHQSVLATATAIARQACHSPRSLAVAHAFVVGGQASDSERQLEVGGTGAVDGAVFADFSYVALGHLHRPQLLGSTEHVRYSGSPLAYSYSETQPKSVSIVELSPAGAATVRTEPIPVGRAVATLTGTLAELIDPTAHPDAHDAFVRAVITDAETVLDAKARLATVYPHVTEIQLRPGGRAAQPAVAAPTIDRLAPIDAVREFWEASEGSLPPPPIDELLVQATSRATAVVNS